ncbi:hypothetical protein [Metabacillus sp. 84]|uniref:hypothetical protein n=1 Tax=unclassified Metabacillus TaxID=2675274 RepID=UPI003CF62CA7
MTGFNFYLEGVNMQPVSVSYEKPDYTSPESSLVAAAKDFEAKSRLTYAGHNQLEGGYRIYYEKSSLFKSKKTYIYYVTEEK